MKLLTTTQVRDIMRSNGGRAEYTNKTTGDTSNIRRVKAYYEGNAKMLAALQTACGHSNVTLTSGSASGWSGGRGVTVKCVLA